MDVVDENDGGLLKEIKFDELYKKAQGYYKSKVNWHFHVLMKNCVLNADKKDAIVLENEDTGEVFVTYFDKRPMKEGEMLEPLLYGRT